MFNLPIKHLKKEDGDYHYNPTTHLLLWGLLLIVIIVGMAGLSYLLKKDLGLNVVDSKTTVVQAEIIDKHSNSVYVYKGATSHSYTITLDTSEFLKDEPQKTFQVDYYTYLKVNKGDWIDCDYVVQKLENGKTTKSLYLHTEDYYIDDTEDITDTERINTTE